MERLRQRMYHFVIYQLSGIQAGIQAGHAKDMYSLKYAGTQEYKDWLNLDKTVIILGGGSTNSEGVDFYSKQEYQGTMQEITSKLKYLGVKFAAFREPDLNNALTAISFLVDERVWDDKKWPMIWDNITCFSPSADRKRNMELNISKYGKDIEYALNLRRYLSNFSLAKN